jgi:hypothetical protein
MVLCRPGARHAYFANALSGTGRVVAIVQEGGMHWTLGNVLSTLRPLTWPRSSASGFESAVAMLVRRRRDSSSANPRRRCA